MKKERFWKELEKNVIIHGDRMNVAESCIDRHSNSKKPALVFQDEKGRQKIYTYKKLAIKVNQFANFLEKIKVKKQSRIFIFLPKIPEAYISLLGSIKHGSIAVPLFEAFQTGGLELRLNRGNADVLVTNSELAQRLKHKSKKMKLIIINSKSYKKKIKSMPQKFDSALMKKKDTALMIFTSSTAGTPVAGIQIPHKALIQQHYTARLVLDLNSNDRYFCTAHPGWVTGSVYGILAPLSIGCTIYIYEGHFKSKDWIKFIRKNKISVIYTAPTALRMLRQEIKKDDLNNIKNMCSVGEALTKAVFDFYKKIGVEINDSYWQTETGAIVIASWPGLKKKSGAIGKAIPGITAKTKGGMICLKPDFPSIMTGIYKHKKMYKSYFKNNWFLTNDSAHTDKQGYFFFEGRKDDIIKTSGERVSPIEIESILMKHPAVRESAVIGIPNKIKGSAIKAFIVLNKKFTRNEKLKQDISLFVKRNYAGHSYPRIIEFADSLPKTNSGKIIRMKLRKG